jgi:hypothetical protein
MPSIVASSCVFEVLTPCSQPTTRRYVPEDRTLVSSSSSLRSTEIGSWHGVWQSKFLHTYNFTFCMNSVISHLPWNVVVSVFKFTLRLLGTLNKQDIIYFITACSFSGTDFYFIRSRTHFSYTRAGLQHSMGTAKLSTAL